MLNELREMKDTLTRSFDKLHEELDELLSQDEALEEEHDEHIADLNEQLCSTAEWIDALDATIRKKEAELGDG